MSKEYLIPENFLNEIENFLRKNNKSFSPQGFQKYASPQLRQWLEERNIPPKFLSYVYRNHLTKIVIPTCSNCGKEISFTRFIAGRRFCSHKCANEGNKEKIGIERRKTCLEKYGVEHPFKIKEIREKSKRTCLEKYGTEYASQSKEFQEKKRKTCLEKYGTDSFSKTKEFKKKCKETNKKRYGVTYASQSKKIQEKSKRTCLEKYGVEYVSQSKEIREKIKESCLNRFGVENPSQSKEIRERVKQTCLEKYGTDSFSKTKEFKEKQKETFLNRYGVECSLQADEIKEKVKQTNLKKYGAENPSQSKEILEKMFIKHRNGFWDLFCDRLKTKDIVPLFSKEEYINDTGRKFKCLCCNKEFETEGTNNYEKEHKNKDGSYTTLLTQSIYCPKCCKKRYSRKEKEVLEFVKSIYKGEILENDRKELEGKELDIFFPSLKFAIEFDGTYWHSKEGAKERDEKKTQLCEEKGIQLFRIKESDWDNDRKSVEEGLKSLICIRRYNYV